MKNLLIRNVTRRDVVFRAGTAVIGATLLVVAVGTTVASGRTAAQDDLDNRLDSVSSLAVTFTTMSRHWSGRIRQTPGSVAGGARSGGGPTQVCR